MHRNFFTRRRAFLCPAFFWRYKRKRGRKVCVLLALSLSNGCVGFYNQFMPRNKKRIFQLLKLIGILLFIWIISKIDRQKLIFYVKDADLGLLALSYAVIYLIYLIKAMRWH